MPVYQPRFLTKEELKTRSHIEIIDAITRGDDTIIDILIDEAIDFMKGYLIARYDTNSVFAATESNRNKTVLKMLKAIVTYEIYSSHNPQMMTQVVEKNNDRAIEWLKAVQKLDLNPDLPLAINENNKEVAYIIHGSNTKRGNHY